MPGQLHYTCFLVSQVQSEAHEASDYTSYQEIKALQDLPFST